MNPPKKIYFLCFFYKFPHNIHTCTPIHTQTSTYTHVLAPMGSLRTGGNAVTYCFCQSKSASDAPRWSLTHPTWTLINQISYVPTHTRTKDTHAHQYTQIHTKTHRYTQIHTYWLLWGLSGSGWEYCNICFFQSTSASDVPRWSPMHPTWTLIEQN